MIPEVVLGVDVEGVGGMGGVGGVEVDVMIADFRGDGCEVEGRRIELVDGLVEGVYEVGLPGG